VSSIPKTLLPFPSEFILHPPAGSTDAFIHEITSTISSLEIAWQWDAALSTGLGCAVGNVWSRQARRKRAQQGDSGESPVDESAIRANATFGFTVSVHRRDIERTDVVLRWVKGTDHVLFESLCGMLKKRLDKS
jgi:23S rRNA (adenine1618-N6)-methyltransferase